MGRFFRSTAIGFAALAVMTFTYATANADEVTVAGFTNGCFGAACVPPSTAAPQSAPLFGLTFNNSNFSGATSAGFLAIGNTPTPPANVNNLGSFTLNGTPANYNGQAFTLRVTFTLPPGIVGSNTVLYNAALTGNVTSINNGGVSIDFVNTPSLFTFTFVNGQGQTVNGAFTFNVNDVSVIAGGTIALSGTITAAQQTAVPEPTTMLLLGTGLVGIAALARKRLKKKRVKKTN